MVNFIRLPKKHSLKDVLSLLSCFPKSFDKTSLIVFCFILFYYYYY